VIAAPAGIAALFRDQGFTDERPVIAFGSEGDALVLGWRQVSVQERVAHRRMSTRWRCTGSSAARFGPTCPGVCGAHAERSHHSD
jgi:hypothetical protein